MSSDSVSIVIASGAGGDFLFRCLDSLRQQVSPGVEVIVVDRCGSETVAKIRRDYPFVTVAPSPTDRRFSVPELRALGAAAAKGDIVAVLEEHCVAPPHWVQTIRTSFRDSDVAIGGPILSSDFKRIRDWVVYFCEYHNYLPPWPDAERYNLNGANIAYRRRELMAEEDILGSGYWEIVLHPRLSKKGRLSAVSRMGVHHTGPFNFGYYLHQRYLLSRAWAGTRRKSVSAAKRLAYLVSAPLFPLLLLARITQRVVRSGVYIRPLIFSLPLLLPATVVYVWGEWLGYLLGPGNALEWIE